MIKTLWAVTLNLKNIDNTIDTVTASMHDTEEDAKAAQIKYTLANPHLHFTVKAITEVH